MKRFLAKKQSKNSSADFHTVFIRCHCYNHILIAHYDKTLDSLDVCLYETKNSTKDKMTLWQKITYIYQIIITGKPYTDQIILNRSQIEELKSFLNKIQGV